MYDTTSPTPPQKRVSSHYITNAIFSSVYICEKATSLAYQEKKKLQDKPIIAREKKNLGKCKHKTQSLFPTESPGEREYASSFFNSRNFLTLVLNISISMELIEFSHSCRKKTSSKKPMSVFLKKSDQVLFVRLQSRHLQLRYNALGDVVW